MAHLLKRLELNGFKSFASKTDFDLSQGITAIVGPNGSGKSNIIDAIRWLLGEREAKNLRGAKSEDLIFAGTAKRPRLGQAQASLFFDNGNRFFPLDFPEIVITREAGRDGTNKYFINRSEVRLRELVDFLAQARLGSRGLVVVTQGNSDMFIQASPLDRRGMIEEMLGLREYQLKKHEAERRLKNTQINLDKVKALTEEILPHLRSLKRQTNRWEKRETLEQELRDSEVRLYGTSAREVRERLETVEKDIAAHDKLRGGLERERVEAEGRVAKVEASQPEERKELQALKVQTQHLLEKRGELQKELGRLEARLEMSERVAPSPAGTPAAAALVALVKKIKTKLELALDEPGKIERAVNEILEEIESVLSASPTGPAHTPPVPPLPAQAGGFKDQFKKIKEDLTDLEKEIIRLKDQELRLEKNQERFYQAYKAAVAELEAAKGKLERWEAQAREKKFEKERVTLKRAELEHQIRQAGREPEDFAKFAGETVSPSERDELERRILRLRGELAAIGEVDEALLKEARETETRYEFLNKESGDLVKAKSDLRELITDLNDKIRTEFDKALGKINSEFETFFGLMFGGGQAKLKLIKHEARILKQEETDAELPKSSEVHVPDEVKVEEEPEEEEENEEGIEIDLKLPRKRITSLEMLSGGERSLVGIAALFALISVSPPPFLVLDEVDAPLDERNARRFAEMLKEFAKKTQFILVTHNRATMEAADIMYGVTMNDDGTSKVLSVKLEDKVPVS